MRRIRTLSSYPCYMPQRNWCLSTPQVLIFVAAKEPSDVLVPFHYIRNNTDQTLNRTTAMSTGGGRLSTCIKNLEGGHARLGNARLFLTTLKNGWISNFERLRIKWKLDVFDTARTSGGNQIKFPLPSVLAVCIEIYCMFGVVFVGTLVLGSKYVWCCNRCPWKRNLLLVMAASVNH